MRAVISEGGRMRRTEIGDRLFEYQFDPAPDRVYGFNLYALVADREALLIDSAYAQQAAEVRADLRSMGCSVVVVLLSHFHPDHISGVEALPEAAVWGSERYLMTLGEARPEERIPFPPVERLRSGASRRFGPFTLTFESAPGHSPCSLYTIINRTTIHVADNLMAANDGSPILPWAPYEAVGAHIRSLERLKALAPELVLLAHGRRIEGDEAIAAEIGDRLSYLRAVQEGDGDWSVDAATAGCTRRFLCEHWHIRRSPGAGG